MMNRNGTQLSGYVMEAAVELQPNVRLVLVGSHDSPAFQSEVLAIIHSLRIARP